MSVQLSNAHLQDVFSDVSRKNAHEPEFIQAVGEVLESIAPAMDRHPEFVKAGIVRRMVEPERAVSFRVA